MKPGEEPWQPEGEYSLRPVKAVQFDGGMEEATDNILRWLRLNSIDVRYRPEVHRYTSPLRKVEQEYISEAIVFVDKHADEWVEVPVYKTDWIVLVGHRKIITLDDDHFQALYGRVR